MSGNSGMRQRLVAAAVVGLLLRAGFAFVYWQDRPLTIDQKEYLLLAERVSEGHGLTYPPGERRLMRSPGYPLFLAATRLIAPGQDAIKAVQCLLGVLSILQVAAIARRLGGEGAAALAAWMAALYPPLVFEPAYILSEPLYTVLALGCVLAAWDIVSPPIRWPRAAVAGLLAGTTLLVRPEFGLFVGLLGLLLLRRRQWLAAVTLGVVTVAVVAPWPAYNALVHGRVIVLSSRGGPNFWMGNNALALGDGDVASNPPMAQEYVALMQGNEGLSAEDLERLFYRRAGEFIRDHPAQWAVLLLKKAFWFIVPFGPSYQSRSRLFFGSQAASWLLLMAASMAAWPRVRSVRPPPVVLAIAAASVVLTCLVFFPLERYRVPLLDPVLLACVGTFARRDTERGLPQRHRVTE